MSIWDYLVTSVQAEEPKAAEEETHEDKDNGSKAVTESESEGEGEKADEPEEAEEEAPAEEEEEEEEPEDAAPAIQDACANSKGCAAAKHHFEECNSRVSSGSGHKHEDCVEEFFHLRHCVDNCAREKIFAALK